MGLKTFWNRLTGGDRDEQIVENLENEGAEHPHDVEDFEEMKDDRMLDERLRGTGWMKDDLER
jgi:hypothetical protein